MRHAVTKHNWSTPRSFFPWYQTGVDRLIDRKTDRGREKITWAATSQQKLSQVSDSELPHRRQWIGELNPVKLLSSDGVNRAPMLLVFSQHKRHSSVLWHLLSDRIPSVFLFRYTVFTFSLSLSLCLHSNVIDDFSFSFCCRVDYRFANMWSSPLASLLLLLLLFVCSFSSNHHLHLIITRLSLIDDLTSGLRMLIDTSKNRSSRRCRSFTQSLSSNFLSPYFTSLRS